MFLAVKDRLLVGVRPWPGHPVSDGVLCSKGWHSYQFVHHKDRLRTPLIREGSSLKEAGWDEAIKLVADKFGEIKNQHGMDSLALVSSAKCTNEENYLAQKFARAVLGTNNIDNCARLCHSPTLIGLGAALGGGAMTNSIPDIEEAHCILVIGSDTSSQHPLIATRIVSAKEKGAKIIVADPRRVELARMADIHLQLRPGTDVALLNGMIKVIIDNGLENRRFIEERTEGFEKLFEGIQDYPPDKVAEFTGVPVESLKRAALTYAKAEASAIVYCMGITQHLMGTDNVLAIANLALLTGNMGKPGSGVNPLRGQNNVQGACDMGALPDVFPGYQSVTDEGIRAKIAEIWGVSELPGKVGLTLVEMIESALSKKIRAMYIIGENPLLSMPDIDRVKRALESLDFLVVQDIFFTETARLAHVVFPAACWAEKDGTFASSDRRVQRIRKAVEPPGGAEADWRIVCQLAKAMGVGNLFPFRSEEEIFQELRKTIQSYRGITYERLNDSKGLQWPCPSEAHPGTPILYAVEFARGRGKFHAVSQKGLLGGQDDKYPYLLTTGRVETQWHTGSMTRRSPALNDEFPKAYVEINPDDAQKLGIEDGEEVEISSRRGRIKTKAFITDRVMPSLIFVPFHFAEAAANLLTEISVDPQAKIPDLKLCACTIGRASK